MCTAMTLKTKDGYSVFGRNLDVDFEYGNSLLITPRNKQFKFSNGELINNHFAIIGSGIVFEEYPLYFDACNEKGLAIAGLNFPGNAYYNEDTKEGMMNIAPYELIPYILSKCISVEDVKSLLNNINIINKNIDDRIPNAPLHWMISDKHTSIVVESMKDGLHVYDNDIGILTNNPPFPHHISRLEDYGNISPNAYENKKFDALNLKSRCVGNGSIGLPGDFSSSSRFIRGAFTLMNLETSKITLVSDLYHALTSVMMYKGLVYNNSFNKEWTVYTSVINQNTIEYTFKNYDSTAVKSVKLFDENLDSSKIIIHKMDDFSSI